MEKNDATAADNEKKTADTATKTSKKGLGARPKLLIVGCVLVFGCLVALILGGTVFAFFSNKNVPVFSDVVETVENTVASESMIDEAIQDDVNDFVFSVLADMATDETEYTKEEAEALVSNKFEADNFRYDVSMEADMGDEGSLDASVVGLTNQKDEMSQVGMDLSGTYSAQGADMDFAGEMRFTDETVYLYVSELPDALAQGLGMDASTLTEQWLSMDSTSTTDTVSSLGVDGGLTQDLTASGSGMTAEDLEKLQELIYSDAMADMVERVDDEVVEGVRTNCFTLTVNQDTLTELVRAYAEIYEEKVDASELGGMMSEGDELLLTACSGRQDGHIYKVVMDWDFEDGTSLSLDAKLWDYGKVEDDVEVPGDAVSLEDYITNLYMQQLGYTQEQQDELNQLLEQYESGDTEDYDWDSLYEEYDY
ncbi:hypothetical protein GF389_01405 [Candidatus Dojkabacteria bacterium]|nr:hypothetical protein [Candidatus Dojkabacteria bacterium]